MIIKPYSEIAQEPFVAADFPAVKHFFPCDEAAGAATVTDVVGGVKITPNSGDTISKPDNYSIRFGNATAENTSGTWSTPGTKLWVLFAVTNAGTAISALIVGTTTGNYINLKTTDPLFNDITLSNSATGTTFTNSADSSGSTVRGRAMVMAAYDSATGLRTYELGKTSYATLLGSTATDATSLGGQAITETSALTVGTGGFTLTNAIAGLYGMAWLEFTTLPADLLAGLSWMTYQWQVGNKVIYPAWKGLS